MISIDDYIKTFRRVHNNPMFKTDDVFSKIANAILENQADTHYREVYSSTFYPQYIRFGERNLFVWDNYYWDVFEGFCQCNILMQYDKNYTGFCKVYFTALLCTVLSLRMERFPYLSLAVAEMAPLLWHSSKSIYYSDVRLKNTMIQIKEQNKARMLPTKLFVFFHEYIHYQYTLPTKKDSDMAEIILFCKRILPEYQRSATAGKRMGIAIQMIARGEDKRAIEEFCCDLRAVQRTTRFWSEFFDTKSSIDAIHQSVLTHVICIQGFQNMVTQIESVYSHYYKFCNLQRGKRRCEIKTLWKEFEPQIRSKDMEITVARNSLLLLAAQLFPEFMTDNIKLHFHRDRFGELFDSIYKTSEYEDFSTSIFSFFCDYDTMERTVEDAKKYEKHLTHANALQKRDILLHWTTDKKPHS